MTNEHFFNPFGGLRPFQENEKHLFFGRANHIKDVLNILDKNRFAAIIGPTGSGKTSLIKSGLIPSIKQGEINTNSGAWKIIMITPGSNPLLNLSKSLVKHELVERVKGINNEDIVSSTNSELEKNSNFLAERFLEFSASKKQNILLIVDQFEEVFSLKQGFRNYRNVSRSTSIFIESLLTLIKSQNSFVVLSLKSDFLGNCVQFWGLPQVLNRGQYLIPKMSRNGIKEAIVEPIHSINASISEPLLEQILEEFTQFDRQLQILQHALMRILDFWYRECLGKDVIDIKHYKAIGKIEKALSNHADEAYNKLQSSEEKHIAELLFKSLVKVGKNSEPTRRSIDLKNLTNEIGFSENKINNVINVFKTYGASFIVTNNEGLQNGYTINLSNESLINEWDRLKHWLKEEEDSSKIYLNLCEAAAIYQEGKGSLLTNPELEVILLWKEKFKPSEKWGLRYDKSFIRAMNFLSLSKEKSDFLILQNEIAQKNKIRRTKIFSIVISLAFIISLGLTVATQSLYVESQKQTQKALNAQADANRSKEEATEARDIALNEEKKALIAAENAEQEREKALVSERKARLSENRAISEQRRAEKAAIAEKKEAEKARKAQNEAKIAEIEAKNERIKAILAKEESDRLKNIAESIQDAYLAINALDEQKLNEGVRYAVDANKKFQLNSRKSRHTNIYGALNRSLIETMKNENYLHLYGIKKIESNIEFTKVAFLDNNGNVSVSKNLKTNSYTTIKIDGLEENISTLKFSTLGNYLILGTEIGEVKVLDLKTYRIISERKFFNKEIKNIYSKSIQGKEYLIVSAEHKLHLLSVLNKDIRLENSINVPLEKFNVEYLDEEFSTFIISNGLKVIMNDISIENDQLSLTEINEIDFMKEDEYDDKVSTITLSKEASYLALGMINGSITLFSMDSEKNTKNIGSIKNHKSRISDLKIIENQTESLLISSSYDNTINLTNIQDLSDFIVLKGHNSWVYEIALDKEKRKLITISEDKTLRNWFIDPKDMVTILEKR